MHSGRFRIVRGSHVFELVPNAGPAKAAAIAALRHFLEERYQRRVFIVYVGERVMDDDAPMALTVDAVTAVAGADDESGARGDQVERLMAQLAVARAGAADAPECAQAPRL